MARQAFPVRNLARALLAGPWTRAEMIGRGGRACGKGRRWLWRLVRRLLAACPTPLAPNHLEWLSDWIAAELRAREQHDVPIREIFPAQMALSRWPVPVLASPAKLAEWLSLKPNELNWFSDLQNRQRRAPPGP